MSEIDQIRDGQWDDRILVDLGVEPQKLPQDVNPTQPQPDVEEVGRRLSCTPPGCLIHTLGKKCSC